jgi:hypothetical protein
MVGLLVLFGCLVFIALLGLGTCSINSDLAERKLEQRLLRDIPEMDSVQVMDIAEWWDPALSAMVGDAHGCKLVFYVVTDDDFARPAYLHATNVGNWQLWCGGSPFADLLDRPESPARGLGINNLRDAVRACARLEDLVSRWPHSYQEVRGTDACYSVPEEPWFFGMMRDGGLPALGAPKHRAKRER